LAENWLGLQLAVLRDNAVDKFVDVGQLRTGANLQTRDGDVTHSAAEDFDSRAALSFTNLIACVRFLADTYADYA
jgi:hypothetical protein